VERIDYYWNCSFLITIRIHWLYSQSIQLMGPFIRDVCIGILANFGRMFCGILLIEEDSKEIAAIKTVITRECKLINSIGAASKITNIVAKNKEHKWHNFFCCNNSDILFYCNVGQYKINFAGMLAYPHCIERSNLHLF